MRIDKYLKVARLIKRRSVANEACDQGRITVNGRVVKASYDDGNEESLAEEDLLIESAHKEGFESNSDYGITVVLDTNLSEELIEEGFVREVISKIQTMRKDSDFEVMDHISVYVDGNEKISAIVNNNADEIKDEVLAANIFDGKKCDNSKEWNINGEKVFLGVTKE